MSRKTIERKMVAVEPPLRPRARAAKALMRTIADLTSNKLVSMQPETVLTPEGVEMHAEKLHLSVTGYGVDFVRACQSPDERRTYRYSDKVKA